MKPHRIPGRILFVPFVGFGLAVLVVGVALAQNLITREQPAQITVLGQLSVDETLVLFPDLAGTPDLENPFGPGDVLQFGEINLDAFGSVAGGLPRIPLYVFNNSGTNIELEVKQFGQPDAEPFIEVLFGPAGSALEPSPMNSTIIGMGQIFTADLGIRFTRTPGTGDSNFTVIFRAKDADAPEPPPGPIAPNLPTLIDFEDPNLGNLCLTSATEPLRDKYAASHGVVFQGPTPESLDGLPVYHECSGMSGGADHGLQSPPMESHSTGDYFLAGPNGTMSNGGNAILPEVINFAHPVTKISFYAACGGSLTLNGYQESGAAGDILAEDTKDCIGGEYQEWQIIALEGSSFRSAKVQYGDLGHSIVLDDLEWVWLGSAPEPSNVLNGQAK